MTVKELEYKLSVAVELDNKGDGKEFRYVFAHGKHNQTQADVLLLYEKGQFGFERIGVKNLADNSWEGVLNDK